MMGIKKYKCIDPKVMKTGYKDKKNPYIYRKKQLNLNKII